MDSKDLSLCIFNAGMYAHTVTELVRLQVASLAVKGLELVQRALIPVGKAGLKEPFHTYRKAPMLSVAVPCHDWS